MKTLNEIITYMENTPDEWQTEVVRSGDKNCFFGHLFNMGKDEKEANLIWNIFEEMYATTYMIYPVNDGSHPEYQQKTAKERVIAYLKDIRDGKQKTTHQLMDEMDEYESLPDLSADHIL